MLIIWPVIVALQRFAENCKSAEIQFRKLLLYPPELRGHMPEDVICPSKHILQWPGGSRPLTGCAVMAELLRSRTCDFPRRFNRNQTHSSGAPAEAARQVGPAGGASACPAKSRGGNPLRHSSQGVPSAHASSADCATNPSTNMDAERVKIA